MAARRGLALGAARSARFRASARVGVRTGRDSSDGQADRCAFESRFVDSFAKN